MSTTSVGLVASVCQPSILRMVICPEASSAQKSMAAVFRGRQDGLGLDAALKFFVQPFDGMAGARRPPTGPSGRRVKVNSRYPLPPGCRRPPGTSAATCAGRPCGAPRPPSASRRRSCRCNRPISFVRAGRGVRQQVPVLVNGAALGRHLRPQRHQRLLQTGGAVDGQESRASSVRGRRGRRAAPARRPRSRRPCSSRRAAPSAVAPHAEDDEKRDRRSLLVEPDATTVPSRISRTMSSASSGRFDQASQSVFTFRRTRLTVSLPTAPLNSAASARRTRRVLVPAR